MTRRAGQLEIEAKKEGLNLLQGGDPSKRTNKKAKGEDKEKPTRVAGLKQPQRGIKALDTRTQGATKLVKRDQ